MDGDGDLDLFLGTQTKGLQFYRNTGTPQKATFTREPLPADIEVPRLASPQFSDFDGDGDSEFFSGGEGGGLIYYSQ
ncbi:MAG: VCBS repeat-containing protein [Fodinibius sp.]|nr:VCBS repeat-containing protein [Fodinibius sp.]